MTNRSKPAIHFRYFLTLLAVIFLAAAIFPAGVSAQEETPVTDDEVNAVAKELYCPECENTPLDVCPTTACAQWRELIREKIHQGWTPEQVKEYFVAQYGDRVLAEPPRTGINWLVYILPPLMILAGGIYLALYIRRMKKNQPVSVQEKKTSAANNARDEYLAAIEAEIKRRES